MLERLLHDRLKDRLGNSATSLFLFLLRCCLCKWHLGTEIKDLIKVDPEFLETTLLMLLSIVESSVSRFLVFIDVGSSVGEATTVSVSRVVLVSVALSKALMSSFTLAGNL